MVVWLAGLGGPFADRAAAGLNVGPLLGLGHVGGEQLVVGWLAEERQVAAVAGGRGQGGVDERLPVVHVRR